jgi:hypothetical protein
MATMVSPAAIGAEVKGRFGAYGGRYVPETLMAALEELEQAYEVAQADPAFHLELDGLLHHYCGRPTPLYYAKRMSEQLGGARIYLKREDLLHTGAHKINNALGQGLLAKRMGKQRIIAETGAGQHGVATATVCALLGLDCVIYMGEEDMRRQELNVYRMRLCDAERRDQRRHARLGDERSYDVLHSGFGAGCASVPDHGAELPSHYFGRGAPAVSGRSGSAAGYGGGLRGWRIECNWLVL